MASGLRPKVEDWLTEDALTRFEGWARDGLTLDQIAKNMGVARSALCRWKKEHREIEDAIKKGRAPVDIEVENQMLKSALGFFVTVKEPIKLRKVMKSTGKDGTKELTEEYIEYADKQVYIPPVPVNQFFWLKNRLPDKWKDHPNSGNNSTLQKLDEVLASIGGVE